MNKKVQEYIRKRDRKRLIRKIVFGTIAFGIIMGTILLKAPFFNLNKVDVKGNKVVETNNVVDSKKLIGSNIFLLDTNKIKNEILKNPYVKTAEVKREFPRTLSINVTERKMVYKVKDANLTYILNKDLVIMAITDDAEHLSLIDITGIELTNKEIGKNITNNESVKEIATKINDELLEGTEKQMIEILDLTDINSIKMFKGDIEIIIGSAKNLEEKQNIVRQIINDKSINLKDGYIDVSFFGKPVIKNNLADEKKEGEE